MLLEPLYTAVIVRRVLSAERDQLGNEIWIEEEHEVPVFGWSVPQASEPKLAGHDRQTVNVELLAPTGAFSEHDAVQLPDHDERLEVIGSPANYDHNPFGWTPGIEVVNLGGIS